MTTAPLQLFDALPSQRQDELRGYIAAEHGMTLDEYVESEFGGESMRLFLNGVEENALRAQAIRDGKHGVVYALQADIKDGPIKIGYTRLDRLGTRMNEIGFMSPLPLKLVAALRGTRATEHYLHQLLCVYRLHGEWFRPTAMVLEVLSDYSEWDPQ